VDVLQCSEHRLCFFGRRRVSLVSRAGSDGSQAKEDESARQIPSLGDVVLHSDVTIAQAAASDTDTLDNLLNARLIDKIVESQLVGILEFKLIIVCQ
jgi:hypothetical protein